jgi:malate synthase
MNAQPKLAPEMAIDIPGAISLQLRSHKGTSGIEILTSPVRQLLQLLHRQFNTRRLELLAARAARQREFDAGALPDFLAATAPLRADPHWRVASVPPDLVDRRVEITGPVDRKMIVNALNAPVQAFMADFEDSTAPTWDNMVRGQMNLRDAVNRSIDFHDPAGGKRYALNERTATLLVRPRGWHLPEKHVLVDGEEMSGALFDFAVFLATNQAELRRRGSGPYFYLPKLESHLEARLWNDVFVAAQDYLGLPRGTIKATVLIETLPAAFEMEEILYELREHIVGLNCGRWDYIFSFIKKLRSRADSVLPDRATVTMDCHFLKSYVALLIQTCHRRGAYAMGGMAAQIPIRNDTAANEAAMARVLADKQREVAAGHDGTWIAHPGLAPIAYATFDAAHAPNQLKVLRADVQVSAADLLRIPEGSITEAGLRHNIRVGVQYLAAWLEGSGCVPLYNLMEDAATAEICRAQLWQWIRHGALTSDGALITEVRVDLLIAEELDAIRRTVGNQRYASGAYTTAARVFTYMVTKSEFDEFLTLPAYEYLP